MIESSSIDTAPKLALMSMNVGSDPVVIPFIRCIVVVGGSEYALNMNDREGSRRVSSWGKVRTLWWKGDTG